jgi:hypothetical protein
MAGGGKQALLDPLASARPKAAEFSCRSSMLNDLRNGMICQSPEADDD